MRTAPAVAFKCRFKVCSVCEPVCSRLAQSLLLIGLRAGVFWLVCESFPLCESFLRSFLLGCGGVGGGGVFLDVVYGLDVLDGRVE